MTFVPANDTIVIEGLDIECIIGIYEHERLSPQHLIVDVELSVDTEPASLSERLELTVDYEWVSHIVGFLLKLGQFKLLETASNLICRALLLPPVGGEQRCRVDAVELKLRKPDALGGRGQPTLKVKRYAGQCRYVQESKPFGTVDIIGETPDVGLYRLNIGPKMGIDQHVHRRMHEAEFVLSHGLLCQGEVATRGSVRVWPLGMAHRYDNPTDVVQSILCIDRPPFVDADEIPDDGQLGKIEALGPWEW